MLTSDTCVIILLVCVYISVICVYFAWVFAMTNISFALPVEVILVV